jgi:hypothetical protein
MLFEREFPDENTVTWTNKDRGTWTAKRKVSKIATATTLSEWEVTDPRGVTVPVASAHEAEKLLVKMELQ